MPTWGKILGEVQRSAQALNGNADFDGIRRRYLSDLSAFTKRDTILYTSNWLGGAAPAASISLEDMQGMMEVCHGLKGPMLDIILHSPGGSAEATASIVRYLRQKFTNIRVFVPLGAMSAATMWALASNVVGMGKHSQLGPIDPQVIIGHNQVPARAIINEFDRAKKEIAENPAVLGAWLPRLQQYTPALLEQCEVAEALAKRLVTEWLTSYMFAGQAGAADKAKAVAGFFAGYEQHQSHSLGIGREQARNIGVAIQDLETDDQLQDLVLSVHHAALLTFAGVPAAVKIIENQNGSAFVRTTQMIPLQPVHAPPGAIPSGAAGQL